MGDTKEECRHNPLATAGPLSRVFICWLTPLLHLGKKKSLEESDMYRILPEDRSQTLGEELQRCWDQEVRRSAKALGKPALSTVLIKSYGRPFAQAAVFAFLLEAIKVVQPLLLWKIIQYFESERPADPTDQAGLVAAYCYAGALALSAMGLTVLQHVYYYLLMRTGMKMRVAICHLIYGKALSLSSESMGRTTTGQIVNLLSNDVNRFDEILLNLHYLWLAPLQAAVIIVLLWLEIGPSCLAGLAAMVLMVPVQTWFGKLFGIFRSKTAELADHRIRIMNEVLSGIRIIKMYAWEIPFSAVVTAVRRKEITQVLRSSYLRGLNMASFFGSSKIIVFTTFTVHVLLGNPVTASSVFVTVSLYGTVKLTVTLYFPLAVEKLSETLVSARRIQSFLLLDEVASRNLWPKLLGDKQENCVEVEQLTCYWDKSLDAPSLQNISFAVKSHQLLTVVGPVGAGKSSLLSAILGELPCDSGTLRVKGQLTYAAQLPWIFPGTIRSNILFGKEMNHHKYERVLRACALKKDLELLPDGDLTLIGDRGATLSGGQRARVNLARAVYQDADIYLLDDPLSAVDAEVGKHLFEQCICGLLRNKCRILVTHQLQHLRMADQVLVLREGHIMAQGSYGELRHAGLDITSLLRSEEEQEQHLSRSADLDKVSVLSQRTARSHGSHSSHSLLSTESAASGNELPAETVRSMAEESRVEGNVSGRVYLKYFTSGCSVLLLLLILLLSVVAEVTYILQDWWLVYWAKEQFFNRTVGSRENHANQTGGADRLPFYLGIYSGLTGGAVLLGFTRSLMIFYVLVRSAQTLHDAMFSAVIRTPVHFFDVNPIGRILNRFSKDVGLMDSMLPITFVDFYQLFLQNVGVVAVAASVIPFILIPVVPLLLFFLYVRRFYLCTSRDVKRLESTTRSPVFSHLSSSLQGLWTIRALRAEERLKKTFDTHQDLHSEAWFLYLMTSRWFALRLDSICSMFIGLAAFSCVLLRDGLEAGEVGLVLTYAVTLVGNFQWTVRQSAEVENMMTSVERVVEYTELKSEAPWSSDKHPAPPNWPSKGQLTFRQMSFSYSSGGPPVLHNISAVFQPCEKIGIVGRTGAGKSSLISALFRLAEPQGRIYIDDVLTSEIGLHDLRQKMSIIPQDPVLFTDTVRKNLDPFNQHADEELWRALEEVQLKLVVEELPGRLETVLAESGSNFSVGQRQLVCLARAILRKNRILIIDEATANVDPRTDELIQKTIRDKFRDCTVLTIAHRLNTIIDSDRILVLDSGAIQELDRPFTLLQNKEGALYKLVQQTGPQEAAALLEAASRARDRALT